MSEFEEAMAELARLRQPVDEFFEKVTVNTDDAKLRENRLRLLSRDSRDDEPGRRFFADRRVSDG